jgi:CBS domain-containing protein
LHGLELIPLTARGGVARELKDEAKIAQAYRQALAFVGWIERQYGDLVPYQLVAQQKSGGIARAFETATGVKLDVAWADFARASETGPTRCAGLPHRPSTVGKVVRSRAETPQVLISTTRRRSLDPPRVPRDSPMNVESVMTRDPKTCTTTDTLHRGREPDVGDRLRHHPRRRHLRRLRGVVTDRDICMATYTQGKPPHDIRVEHAMSTLLFTLAPTDSITTAANSSRIARSAALPS